MSVAAAKCKTLPEWPEPPDHTDLSILDATVLTGEKGVADNGRVTLRHPEVSELASRHEDRVHLLEEWPS